MAKKKVPKGKLPGKVAPSFQTASAETSNESISWSYTHYDHECSWPILGDDLPKIFAFFKNIEGWTVNEIHNDKSGRFKTYPIGSLPCKAARKHLESMNLDDQDVINRFRLTGPNRLYGFLRGTIFHVVFWDPKHEIWPSNKD